MKKFFLVFVLLMVPLLVHSEQVQFIYSGTGTGSIGAIPFENLAFAITAYGDTNNAIYEYSYNYPYPGAPPFLEGWRVDHDSVTILLGSTLFNILTPTYSWWDDSMWANGFSRDGMGKSDLLYWPGPNTADGIFHDIGPITLGPAILANWGVAPLLQTTGGTLIFEDRFFSTGGLTFTERINPVPEPSSLLLFAYGCLILTFLRKKSVM